MPPGVWGESFHSKSIQAGWMEGEALQPHTCFSWSFRRSSVTPRARMPRARHADCNSLTFRLSTPSSAISYKRKSTKHMWKDHSRITVSLSDTFQPALPSTRQTIVTRPQLWVCRRHNCLTEDGDLREAHSGQDPPQPRACSLC